MTDDLNDQETYREERSPSGLLLLIVAVALLAALGGLIWSYALSHRLAKTEAQMQTFDQQNMQLTADLAATDRRLRATSEELGDKLGITQRQIEDRAQQILHQQQAATSRLAKQQAETREQVGAISNTVSSVQSDVGGVKTDVASTKADLAQTQQQLQRTIGDLGVQSGLIATNKQELEYLKHLGDRNYYEFTLRRGQKPQAISTIKLQLHKADPKHSRYTMEVFSDDKKIEKKDRNLDEPVQFYSGKQPMLFELVVNQINKNEVAGYLSTPKNAPQPNVP
jgi:multidrug efflux pump subunit AcrA (membrane-fusion protein)